MAFCDPLHGDICELFEEFVIPKNVLPVFRREKILTKKDIGAIQLKSDCEGARHILDIVVQKRDWFMQLHTILCDSSVKLQHIAAIMMHENNRIQHQSASNQRSRRKTRVENSGPASTLSALYIKYNRNLEHVIRELFVPMIDDPVAVLHVFQTFSNKVLTKIDCDNVKAKVQNNGSHEGADLLFSRLILYDSWLGVLLKALKHDDIRLQELAEEIELRTRVIKEDYERNRTKIERLYNMNNNRQEDNRMATDDPGSVLRINGSRDNLSPDNFRDEYESDCAGSVLRINGSRDNLSPDNFRDEYESDCAGSVLRINGSRDNLSPDNFRDEYESDCAEMTPAVKRQARGRRHKENTFSDGGGRNLALQEGSSKTPLMSAAASGDLDLILNLLDGGASIDESDSNGRTALMYAVFNHQFECLQLFISKGCDVNKRDNNGCTALMISVDKNFTDCLRLLIQAKSNVDNAKDKGSTALMVAARQGFVDCMQLLIENYCDVDKCQQNGRTALMYAAFNGHSECVDLLIRSNCDVNKADNKRATALKFAVKSGQKECEHMLINGGAT